MGFRSFVAGCRFLIHLLLPETEVRIHLKEIRLACGETERMKWDRTAQSLVEAPPAAIASNRLATCARKHMHLETGVMRCTCVKGHSAITFHALRHHGPYTNVFFFPDFPAVEHSL